MVTALLLAASGTGIGACLSRPSPSGRLRIALSFPVSAATAALDGRLLLLLSTDGTQEPRFQITDNDRTVQVFGADVNGLRPGQETLFDSTALGYPVASLANRATR